MNILLFLDFYSGDILGTSTDWWHDLSMALIAAILSGLVVAWGINYERSKENKKIERELRYSLYNLHVHLNHIIQGANPIPNEYNEFVAEISKKRLDSAIAHRPRRQIPPLDRVLRMDIDKLFQAFLITFSDRKQATLDCNNIFTCAEYLNRILTKLEDEYEDSMTIRFQEMQKFNDILMEIQRQLRHLGVLLNKDVSSLLNEAIKISSTNLEDYYNQFVTKTEEFVKTLEPRIETLLIEDEIKKIKESIKVILLRTEELENMLTENTPEITSTITNITTLNTRLKSSLGQFLKVD